MTKYYNRYNLKTFPALISSWSCLSRLILYTRAHTHTHTHMRIHTHTRVHTHTHTHTHVHTHTHTPTIHASISSLSFVSVSTYAGSVQGSVVWAIEILIKPLVLMTFFTDSIVCCLRRVLRVCDHWRSTNSVCLQAKVLWKITRIIVASRRICQCYQGSSWILNEAEGASQAEECYCLCCFQGQCRVLMCYWCFLPHSESNWTVYEASPLWRSVILPQTGLSSIDIILQQMDLIMHLYPNKLLRHEAKHLQRMDKQVHKPLNETLTFDVTL